MDLMSSSSKSIFSVNRDPLLPNYGQGGNPETVLYRLLTDMEIKFSVKPVHAPMFVEARKLSDEDIKLTGKDLIKKLMHPDYLLSDDVVTAGDLIFAITPISPINKLITVRSIPFKLEACTITYEKYNSSNEIVGAHAIVGFVCDSIYKIYDSSTNQIHKCDWWYFADPDVYATIIDNIYIYRPHDTVVKNFNVTACLYVNVSESHIKKYIIDGSC